MEELVNFVANIGFPIAISCYLLVRLEKKLEELSTSIYNLSKIIECFEKKD